MATDKPRYSVTMEEETLARVQRFREENNIATQSKAIIKLVELALNDITSKDLEVVGETILLRAYRELNEEGQEKLLSYADDLTSTGKYKKGRENRLDTKEA